MAIKKNIPNFIYLPEVVFDYDISNDARVLYAILFTNGGFDVQVFTRAEAQSILNVSKPTIIKTFKELVDTGLIVEVRQGLNKPNLIRVVRSTIMKGVE